MSLLIPKLMLLDLPPIYSGSSNPNEEDVERINEKKINNLILLPKEESNELDHNLRHEGLLLMFIEGMIEGIDA